MAELSPELAYQGLIDDLLMAVRPLLDKDTVTPFMSAWEIRDWNDADGEVMWENLRAAAVALDPSITVEPFPPDG